MSTSRKLTVIVLGICPHIIKQDGDVSLRLLRHVVRALVDPFLAEAMPPQGPEHDQVRLPLIDELRGLGWDEDQIQWTPEWRVPKPSLPRVRHGARKELE